jgi:hypothetical protein
MIEYIINKFYNDYMLVSLDGTIGNILTNLLLVHSLWSKRINEHMIKNENKFNINKFMIEHPIPSS